MSVREEVIEHLIEFMRAAEDKGKDGWKAAEAAFPGTPTDVIAAAWCELENRRTAAWWQAVEKTIDGEVIRAALLKNGSGE